MAKARGVSDQVRAIAMRDTDCDLTSVIVVRTGAGIQTLVSLSSPTGLALQWARRHRLNLIHLPHHSAPRVYSPAQENCP